MVTIVETRNENVKPIYRGTQIVWYILYLIEILLLFRFLLKLISANAAGFTNFIYNVTYPIVYPFLYVIPSSRQISGVSVEWSTLLAMIVYWLVAIAIIKLFLIGKPVSNTEAEVKLDEQDRKVN